MSYASDVYGRGMTPRQARRAISSKSTSVPVSTTTPSRAESVIALPVRLPMPKGNCSYVGQSWRFSSCDCTCHFGEPYEATPQCDTALTLGSGCNA